MEKKIHINPKTGLVLEGGGMRGVFTCGVLDSFMDRGIRFPYTIGVSAGACNGLSYMMMGFLGIGNNPMVGCTVACAVDVATALSK